MDIAVEGVKLVVGALVQMGVQHGAENVLRGAAARLNAGKLDPNHEISRAARRAHLRACVYLLKEVRRDVEPAVGGLLSSVGRLLTSSPFDLANANLLRLLAACEKETAEQIEARWPQGGYDAVETAMDQLLAAEKGDWRRAREANAEAMTGQALEEVRQAGGWNAVPDAVTRRFRDATAGWPAAFASFLAVEVKRNDDFFRIQAALMQAETLAEVKALREELGGQLVGGGSIEVFETFADAFREQSEKLDELLRGQAGLQESLDLLPEKLIGALKGQAAFGDATSEPSPTAHFVVDLNWTGPLLPPPSDGEAWETVGSVIAPKRWLMERGAIRSAFWAGDALYFLTDHDHVQVFVAYPLSGEGGELFQKETGPRFSSANGLICSIAPLLPDGNSLVVVDTQRVSVWNFDGRGRIHALGSLDPGTVAELKKDGSTNRHLVATVSRFPFERPADGRRDHYHDISNRASVSKDGRRIAHSYMKMADQMRVHYLRTWTMDPTERESRFQSFNDFRASSEMGLESDGHMSWSPSSEIIAFGTWAGPTYVNVAQSDVYRSRSEKFAGSVRSAWHPTRDVLAVAGPREREPGSYVWLVEIQNAATGERIVERNVGHSMGIRCIDWSPDGRYIATGGEDHAVIIWDLLTDRTRTLFGGSGTPTDVEFSPDGQRLACGGLGGNEDVSIRDPASGKELARIPCYSAYFAWHFQSRMIALQTGPHSIEVRRLAI